MNFGWKGPNAWHGGTLQPTDGFKASRVQLIFKDSKNDISVSIPSGSTSLQKFLFRCIRNEQACESAILNVTSDQIYNLTIKISLFTKSHFPNPTNLNESVRVRSDCTVKLEIPEKLELGQTYTLVITSKENLALSACLVKEGVTTKNISSEPLEDTQFHKEQSELLIFLWGQVTVILHSKLWESQKGFVEISKEITLKSDAGNQIFGIDEFKNEIEKIDKNVLSGLLQELRTAHVGCQSRVDFIQRGLKIGAACFDIIGNKILIDIFSANITAFIEGTITPEVQQFIDETAENCLKIINKYS